MKMRVLMPLLLGLLLAACVGAPRAADPDSGLKSDPTADSAGQVDYSCKVDSDCEVKNVGNCCGHYPACVNRASPTFPEQVAARCQAEGTMSICGFPVIEGCRCVDNRCQNATAGSGGLPLS